MTPAPGAAPFAAARWARRDLAQLVRWADGRPALVTGASGFLGRWLTAHLVAAGIPVVELSRHGGGRGPGRRVVRHDLELDPAPLAVRLARRSPAVVFHLAAPEPIPGGDGVALVGASLRQTQHLLDVCLGWPARPRVIVVSSGAVYGAAEVERLSEGCPPAPATFHGVAKGMAEALAARAGAAGLPVLTVRPFNVAGPGQSATRVLARFAQQVAELEEGRRRPPIVTRGLETDRDFVDVRDVVTAMVAVAVHGRLGAAYNVCSGEGTRIGALLDQMLGLAGLRGVPVRSTSDGGVDRSVGDPTRLRALGWRPAYRLSRTLRDVLDDWRARPRRPLP